MKIEIVVEEKLTYKHSITIEVDEEFFNEDKFNDLLNKAELTSHCFGDVVDTLSEEYNVIESEEMNIRSPYSTELLIPDYKY